MASLHSSLRALIALTFFAAASLVYAQTDDAPAKLAPDQTIAYRKAQQDFAARERRQPARFVHGQQVLILKQHSKVPRRVGLHPRRTMPHQRLPCTRHFASARDHAVNADFPVVQFLLPGQSV